MLPECLCVPILFLLYFIIDVFSFLNQPTFIFLEKYCKKKKKTTLRTIHIDVFIILNIDYS
jgi:hypothetical protein